MNESKHIIARKFSPTASHVIPDILQGKTPQAFLQSKYVKGCIFGQDNLMKDGVYLCMGWAFNFRPFLKLLLVKQYGRWEEIWAPNKTTLRTATHGRIDRIVELKP
jgi:hypothetical protein